MFGSVYGLIVIAYGLLIFLSARIAISKGHGWGGIVTIGIFFTPIVSLIVAACLKNWNYVPPPEVHESPPDFNNDQRRPDRDEELKRMRDSGLISKREYEERIK